MTDTRILGGMQGPAGTLVQDLGGQGDCGWRCAAFYLCMANSKWKGDRQTIKEKISQLASALRAQCLHHLLNTDRSWESFWCPDNAWTSTTEAGVPAKTVEEFRTVLKRPLRWICHLGWQALASVKQVHIVCYLDFGKAWVGQSCSGQPQRALPKSTHPWSSSFQGALHGTGARQRRVSH